MLAQEEANLESIRDFYTNRSRLPAHKSCGWSSPEQQIKRFEQLTKILSRGDYSLNDFGCGDGSLLRYLIEQEKAPWKYRGFDLIQNNVDKTNSLALEMRPKINATVSSAITEPADFTIASGTFNVMLGNGRGAWETYVERALKNMSEKSVIGFGVNFLSKSVFEPGLYVTNSDRWKEFCSRFGKVEVIGHYLPDDFTLLVHKILSK